MAWHIAALSRADLSKISLTDLTGETSRAVQSPDQMQHSLKLWRAALSAKFAANED